MTDMNIVDLIGSSSMLAKATYDQLRMSPISKHLRQYGRKCEGDNKLDLLDPKSYIEKNEEVYKTLVSFAPIWIFEKFITEYFQNVSEIKIKRIVCCSSTSAKTKQYSFSNYDKSLSKKIRESEQKILKECQKHNISLVIIRPTLIYGNYKNKKDSNVSTIARILKYMHVLILPSRTGERQPIHVTQLASVITHFALEEESEQQVKRQDIVNVGGDEIISYNKMIKRIAEKRGVKLVIIYIPNRIFYFIASIVLLFNEKMYASLLRMNSDLSDFKLACKITNNKHQDFMDLY